LARITRNKVLAEGARLSKLHDLEEYLGITAMAHRLVMTVIA
jgi:hypothetical protein